MLGEDTYQDTAEGLALGEEAGSDGGWVSVSAEIARVVS